MLGLFPMSLDLPVKLTDTPRGPAKDMGVFKNARGWIRGWDLPENEQKRLEELEDAEVVLTQRPRRLFIEVANST